MGLWESVTLAAAPALFWLWMFYRRDRWEREPKRQVLKLFACGALVAAPVWWLEGALPGAASPVFDDVVRVALVEELFKLLPVLLVAYRSCHFDEPMDGIVYAVATALGFATVENVLYAQAFGPALLVHRVFVSTLVHVGCSGLLGAVLGLTRFRIGPRARPLAVAFAAVVGVHGAFDLALRASGSIGRWAIAGVLPVLLVLLFRATNRACRASPFRPGPQGPRATGSRRAAAAATAPTRPAGRRG